MDRHITLLIKLLEWYWDNKRASFNKWETISLETKQMWINYYIYNYLKYNIRY